MDILRNISTPTGNILIVGGEKGKLECLSLGDYGKEKNIKADFMGLSREINGVPNGALLPLSEKWVITISSQYGCSMSCRFCDVPKVGPGINASFQDLIGQVTTALALHPEITAAKRINVHFARMGEPLLNSNIVPAAMWLAGYFAQRGWGFHPVVSTMVPADMNWEVAQSHLNAWGTLKNVYLDGNAGLQLSINTTDEALRNEMFNGKAMCLAELGSIVSHLAPPKGRKYTLNFALTGASINPRVLLRYFDPVKWLCKITPMHMTSACKNNNLVTQDGYDAYYPYKAVEDDLKEAGYDVIVFIPSKEEDESMITCGNAILSEHE